MAEKAETARVKLPRLDTVRRYISVAKEAGASEVRFEADGAFRIILKSPEVGPSALDDWKRRREAR